MADTVSAEQRSRNMARIRSKNTKPELLVRRLLHAAGYRFRLHGAAAGTLLPGKPDLVFASRHKVVFVNGCFWHLHSCRAGQHAPQSNSEFWAEKRSRTARRDAAAVQALAAAGWESLTVWECELKDRTALEEQLAAFLGPSPRLQTTRKVGQPPGFSEFTHQRGNSVTTEPTGPANDAADPLGPGAPQPEPTGDPRRPGQSRHGAANIREAQGTSPGGTVPAGHSAGSKDPGSADDGGSAPEDALDQPESSDG